jgi:hypothetical protein
MIIAIKCWIENTDVVNGLFLILKMSDVTCQLKLKIYIYSEYQNKLLNLT